MQKTIYFIYASNALTLNIMRKLIITISMLTLSATTSMCQTEWERPEDQQAAVNNQKKQQSAIKKAERESEKAKLAKAEEKYLAGAISEKDGKIEWVCNYKIQGASAEELYGKTLSVLQKFTKQEGQLPQSAVTLLNKKKHIIVASVWEWLIFKNSFLSLDKAKFNYLLIAKCTNGNVRISMQKLRYIYDDTGKGEEIILAEDAINDKNALNKKKTKLVPGWAKFRRKTIDRKDEVFNDLAVKLK